MDLALNNPQRLICHKTEPIKKIAYKGYVVTETKRSIP